MSAIITRDWRESIQTFTPCTEAVEWLKTQPDAATAWAVCQRGDWMLWLLSRLSGEVGSDKRRPLVLAVCECARLSLRHVPADEARPLMAIETAEAWARGISGVTLQVVRTAADAAYTAAADAAYAAADAAAYIAADAAAAAAADAAADAAYAAARCTTLAVCADIVRRHYPVPPDIKDE